MVRILSSLLLLAAAVLLTACGGSSNGSGDEPEGTMISGAVGLAPESVRLVPATAEDVLRAVQEANAEAVLVNIWSTWCEPCVEEFPFIVRLRDAYRDRGLRVLFVSADFDEQLDEVREFLAGNNVGSCYLKVGGDMEFIDAFGSPWTGALPATFVYDGEARLVGFWQGEADYETFERAALEALGLSE